jgi:hypothetical protein
MKRVFALVASSCVLASCSLGVLRDNKLSTEKPPGAKQQRDSAPPAIAADITVEQLLPRANLVASESKSALKDAKEPYTPTQLRWQKVGVLASEAVTAAQAAIDAEKAAATATKDLAASGAELKRLHAATEEAVRELRAAESALSEARGRARTTAAENLERRTAEALALADNLTTAADDFEAAQRTRAAAGTRKESRERIARDKLQDAVDAKPEEDAATALVHSSFFRLHAGAATIRPWVVTGSYPGTRTLEASSDTAFYAEADFLYRTAWLEPKSVSLDLLEDVSVKRLVPQDYEIRLGFIDAKHVDEQFAGSFESSTDTIDGDWYAEATLGWVLGIHNVGSPKDPPRPDLPRGTWNLEFDCGFITDREGMNTTGYYQVGPGTTWGIPVEVGGKRRLATVAAGVYLGAHEFPSTDPNNQILSEQRALPFNRRLSLGVKLDFTVPITNGLEVVLQGRHAAVVSNNDIPDDWSLFVGLSIPVGRLVRDLFE